MSNFDSTKVAFTIPFLILFVPGLSVAQKTPTAQASPDKHASSAKPLSSSSAVEEEDWNSLSIESSHFEPSTPLVGQIDEGDDFTRELTQVQWRSDDPIYLYVIRPKHVQKPPAILYLYNYDSDIDRFRDDALCSFLVKNGFAAIGFVSALSGHRYHDRGVTEWFVSELQESLVSSAHDVQMVLNYLATRRDVDMDRIGIFGEGSGASIAILASAVDARLRAIDLFAPWGDWPDWLAKSPVVPEDERAGFLKPEFLKRVASFDPVDWLPRVKASAVRLQYADDQWGTPKVVQNRIKAAAPNRAKVISYPDMKSEHAAAVSLFDWIKEQLSPIADHASPVGEH